MLSTNNSLPLDLQQAILAPLDATSPSTPILKQHDKKPSTATSIPQHQPILKSSLSVRSSPHAYYSPYSFLPRTLTSYAHASRNQRFHVPSLTPVGLDPHTILSQREEMMKHRIQHEINSLEMNKKSFIKDTIQLKALKLHSKQQQASYLYTSMTNM